MFAIGCHLSIADGYPAMGEKIRSLGGNTFQYFTKNPRGKMSVTPPSDEDVSALLTLLRENGMTMPLAHAPYTYNPCSQKEEVRQYSGDSMHNELLFLEKMPGSLYNFHPGSHTGQGVDVGIAYISDMLNRVMWQGMRTTVLLETMSGKGSEIGANFEELAELIHRVDPMFRDSVGVCFDTCHVSDAGYDLVTDLDGVLREFDRVVGLDRLRAVHLNDSMNPRGSHKDRHAKIGEGFIGKDALLKITNHPLLKDRPFYLETPNDEDGYAREIAFLKENHREN